MKKLAGIILIFVIILVGCQDDDGEEALREGKNAQLVNHNFNQRVQFNIEVEEEDEHIVPNDHQPEEQQNALPSEQTERDSNQTERDENPAVVVQDPLAIDVIVNKERKLPDGFVPPDLVEPNVPFSFSGPDEKRNLRQEAARALEQLFESARGEGIELFAVSGYRSYERQYSIYHWNVNTYGQAHADKYSAVPGHSEHQTGLAMDVSAAVVSYGLVESFGNTDEGQWLAENAHHYGFIIRYPKGKSHITGYNYEPWHLRYFGRDLATDIYESGLTVEEYYGLTP